MNRESKTFSAYGTQQKGGGPWHQLATSARAALFVELYVKNSAFVKGLQASAKTLQGWGDGISSMGKKLMAAGAAVAAPALVGLKAWASYGDEMLAASQRTGIAVESLSALQFAAQQSNVDAETLEGGVRKMQKSIGDAAGGSKEAAESLASLGLSLSDLTAMSPDQQFKTIGDAISHIQDPTMRAAAAMQIFGKSGTSLLPMLTEGRAGIEALEKQAADLGLVLSTDAAKAADELNDKLDVVGMMGKGVARTLGATLAPMVSGLAEIVIDASKVLLTWIKANGNVIRNAVMVATAVFGIGASLLAIGVVIAKAGALLGFLATTITTVAGVFGSAFGIVATIVAAAISPMGLLLAAVAAIGYALASIPTVAASFGAIFSWIGDTAAGVFADLTAGFANVMADGTSAFNSIAESISAGNIQGAISVALAFVKLEWLRLVNWATAKWEGFANFWAELWAGMSVGFVNALATIKGAWAEVVGWMQKMWESFSVSSFTEKIANIIAPIFAKIQGVSTEDARKALGEDMARGRANLPNRQAEIDAQTAASKAQIEKDRQASIAGIGGGLSAGEAARAKATADAEAALQAAKDQFAQAKASASAANAAKQFGTGGGKTTGTIGGGTPIAVPAAAAITSAGTFSGYAAAAMGGGGGANERTAAATLRMVGQLARMLGINVESLAELRALAKSMGYSA